MSGGFLGPDGKVTKFFEGIPGYVASLGHAIKAGLTDDDEHLHRARRAFASSTKAAIVTGATIGGTIVCGPAGAVAGAAIGSTTGQLFEKTVNETIEEPLQTSSGCFHNSHPQNFVNEVLVETGTAFIGVKIAPIGQSVARSVVGTGGGAERYVARKAVENAITVPQSQMYKHNLKGTTIDLRPRAKKY